MKFFRIGRKKKSKLIKIDNIFAPFKSPKWPTLKWQFWGTLSVLDTKNN